MGHNKAPESSPVFIRGPQLRRRWGISNTRFYEKLKRGLIPAPCYPFGECQPCWSLCEIEAFERHAMQRTDAMVKVKNGPAGEDSLTSHGAV